MGVKNRPHRLQNVFCVSIFNCSDWATEYSRTEAQAQLPVGNTRHGSGLINYGSINTLLTSGPTRYANGA